MKHRDFRSMDDAELLKLTAENNENAFEELLFRYERAAYNIAYFKLKNEEDAKETVWEAFLKLWHSAGSYRGDGNVSSYIYTIVKNCAADLLRKREYVQPIFAEDENGDAVELPIEDDGDTPEEAALRTEEREKVRLAINELPDKYREVVTLYDIEGVSYQKIAEMLSIDIGTVKSRLSRARKRLRKILENTKT